MERVRMWVLAWVVCGCRVGVVWVQSMGAVRAVGGGGPVGFRAQTNTHLTCTCLPACLPARLPVWSQSHRPRDCPPRLPQYRPPQYRVACQEGLIACTAVSSANPIRPPARD